VGCTDATATNYDPLATVNEGCEYEPDPNTNGTETNQSTNSSGLDNNGSNSTNTTGNTTDSTNSTGSTNTNETNGNATMQTCEGCCGDTFEVPSDEMCPVVDCASCDEVSTTGSSSATVVRNVLVGLIVVAGLMLWLGARRPPEGMETMVEQDPLHDEN
jgi:hypothetical protein